MTKFKVLMADSNPQMLSMMKEYFTAQENVSVFDTVTDGVSALEALHKTRYDVLITELIMPRADGFEIMERIAAGLSAISSMRLYIASGSAGLTM